MQDEAQLGEAHAEGARGLTLGPVLCVLGPQAEGDPVGEREAEEGHDAGCHARHSHL